MDKGKQPTDEGSQCKRKWAMSIKSDESSLMEDARRAGHKEEFFNISPGADLKVQLADVVDR